MKPVDPERWREIDRVFQNAVNLPPPQRGPWLDAECGDDDELRSEVEVLLALDSAGHPILDRPEGLSLPADLSLPISPGDRVGSWLLGAQIGEGGGGVVFEAHRADRRYERRVAIKFLKQALLTPRAAERFRTECRVLGRLDHPHIARLVDAGATETGVPYIVLEWVDGRRLDDWRRRDAPDLEQRLDLFEQICGAVACAHRNLIVHRDLKPSNVLVTADGHAKLLDFGIARVLPGEGTDEARITGTHAPLTPQYASPEQLRSDEVTTASDVYSLGLLLYELVTGSLPYDLVARNDEQARHVAEGAMSISPPSAVAARNSPDAVPASAVLGDLDAIILTALEAEPSRRYHSAQALLDDLERLRRRQPVWARTPSFGYVLKRFVGRHRLSVGLALTALTLLVGFAVTMAVVAGQLAREQARSEAEAATAREVVRFLGGLFEGAEPAVHQGHVLTARQLLDRGAEMWASTETHPPEVRGALAAAIGKAYLELSLLPEARQLLTAALALRQPLDDSAALADSHRLMARLEWVESDYRSAIEHAETAVRLLESLDQPAQLAEALALLGRSQVSLGDADAAEASLLAALDRLEPGPERDPARAGVVHRELATLYLNRGQPELAIETVHRALELLTAAHGDLHPDVFEARRLLAALHAQFPRPGQESSAAILEQLLADQRTLFGDAHEQIVWTLIDLASEKLYSPHPEQAAELYRRARDMQASLLGGDPLSLAVIESGLGWVLRRQGDHEPAIEAFERSLEITRRNVEPGSYDLAFPLLYLGETLADSRRCREALPLLDEAAATFEQVLDRMNFGQLRARWHRGFCLWTLGEAGGEQLMRETLATAEAGFGERTEDEYRDELDEWRRLDARLASSRP
ncbi:MAG: serine/threonine-protein kinase [Acidobacteriota bacterium]